MTGRTCCLWLGGCSDKGRCDAYGSCVAAAQALNKADIAAPPRSDETIKPDARAAEPESSNDGPYIDWPADGNQRNQTEELPAFEVRIFEPDCPARVRYRIYESGRTEGFDAEARQSESVVVFNRIPVLIAQAQHEGWRSAMVQADRSESRPSRLFDGILVGAAGMWILLLCADFLGF